MHYGGTSVLLADVGDNRACYYFVPQLTTTYNARPHGTRNSALHPSDRAHTILLVFQLCSLDALPAVEVTKCHSLHCKSKCREKLTKVTTLV